MSGDTTVDENVALVGCAYSSDGKT